MKRNAIMEAALELIAEGGFHGAPMALIAERAGVGTGTIYRYFSGKDDLIVEICREIEKRIMDIISSDYPADEPLKARFLHIGTALLNYFIAYPLHFRYLEQYHNSPYGVSHRRDIIFRQEGEHDLFKSLLSEGMGSGALKDLPVYVHFALAFGPLTSLARDHVAGLITLEEELIEKSVAACWDAMKK